MKFKTQFLEGNKGNLKAIVGIPGWAQKLDGGERSAGDPISAFNSVPLLYRAVTLRAQALSSVPSVIFKNGEETEWPIISNPLSPLLYNMELALMLTGAAYILKQYQGRALTGLQWLNPTTVKWEYKNGRNVFSQRVGNETFGPWSDEEIVYMREPSMDADTGPGLAPAQVALMSSQLRFNMDEFANNFFKHGAQPSVLISTNTNPAASEVERAESFFQRRLQGVTNAWKMVLMRGDYKINTLTPELKSMAMTELQQHVVLDIGAALGVPRSILESDAANYATSQTDLTTFWEMTVRPRLDWYGDAINRQIFGDSIDAYTVKFMPENLDVFQVDESARAGSLLQLVQAGIPLPQAMAMLGYDPVDNVAEVPPIGDNASTELRAWQTFALNRLGGKQGREFEVRNIDAETAGKIKAGLSEAKTAEEVRAVFGQPTFQWKGYP
jgi:HK97 family phage portal protein